MEGSSGAQVPINSFSLVAYLPDPLAGFVDALRREVQPGCTVRAHVTILPPRPLPCSTEEAADQIEAKLQNTQPFLVELAEVRVFAVTQVIHLALGSGAPEFHELHERLSTGCLAFEEAYYYHPHVTLAQALPVDALLTATQTAIERWREYSGERKFLVERLTLVQNTDCNQWMNLKDIVLQAPVAV